MDFLKSYLGKNEPLGTKVFNWSEVHFYRSTSYKIHTLITGMSFHVRIFQDILLSVNIFFLLYVF